MLPLNTPRTHTTQSPLDVFVESGRQEKHWLKLSTYDTKVVLRIRDRKYPHTKKICAPNTENAKDRGGLVGLSQKWQVSAFQKHHAVVGDERAVYE